MKNNNARVIVDFNRDNPFQGDVDAGELYLRNFSLVLAITKIEIEREARELSLL